MDNQFLDFKIIKKTEKSTILAQCKGENSKGVFLFYHEKESDQLPFLSKILGAVQLDITKDVLVLAGTDATSFSINDFRAAQEIRKIVVFGFPPNTIGVHLAIQKYQITTIQEGHYLFADSLEAIAASKELKGKLWSALKLLF